MAGGADDTEKTEEPTQKRLEEARRRGDVPKSAEVNTWFAMIGAALVVLLFPGLLTVSLDEALRPFLAGSHAMAVEPESLRDLFSTLGAALLAALAGPFALLAACAVAANLLQHGPIFSTESLGMKVERVSPLAGARRLFSRESLLNLAKGLIKIGVVSVTLAALLWPERDRLESTVRLDLGALLPLVQEETARLLGAVVAVLAFVVGLDFIYQRRRWYERQRMSVQELKEEYRQSEGDPAIKARIRRIRLERSRRRMMADVPKASVVIVNPVHFAVALRYERGMNAPVCLAKGADDVALKIRAVAEEHAVPVVENPPLARVLHGTVGIGEEIPEEHYKAVAEIIGFVMRLSAQKRWKAT
jgi:flagellar biosynthetic protein FlhB